MIRWSETLFYVLLRMDFGAKWRRWMQAGVSSVSFSILVNGSPKDFFKAQRGLREGDPLSHFLFVIVGEALSRMFSKALEANLISGFRPSLGGPLVTHLHFADDTIIFFEAKKEEIRNVKVIMHCFEVVLGLRVNFFKSEMVRVGVEEDQVLELAGVLG